MRSRFPFDNFFFNYFPKKIDWNRKSKDLDNFNFTSICIPHIKISILIYKHIFKLKLWGWISSNVDCNKYKFYLFIYFWLFSVTTHGGSFQFCFMFGRDKMKFRFWLDVQSSEILKMMHSLTWKIYQVILHKLCSINSRWNSPNNFVDSSFYPYSTCPIKGSFRTL